MDIETDESLHIAHGGPPYPERQTIRRFPKETGCGDSARPATNGHIIWLFAGSDDGGERAAAIYTLVGTAKLNELNPEAYLRHVLERIADHPINRIEELLPWNVVLAVQTATSLAA